LSSAVIDLPRSQAPSSIERWYVLILMCLIYAINIADRYVVSTVLEPIRLELKLTDHGVAFLTGTPLAVFYVVFGIPISWLADRSNRRNILASSLIIWSAFTALCGMSRNYAEFLLGRIGVGVGEAGGTPPSTAIVSDCFPPDRRPMAMTVLALGAPIGAWLGADMAGAVAHAFTWRAAFIALGVPGLVIGAIVYLTVREPSRGRLDAIVDEIKPSLRESLRFLWEQKAAFHIVIGGGLCALWGWGLIWWTPTFLQRAYNLDVGQAGAVTGNIHLVGGSIATIATAYWTHSLFVCKLMFWMFIPAIYFYIGPCFGLLNNLAPCHMRNMFIAISLLVANILNIVVAPQAVGFLSDWFGGPAGSDAASLRLAMLILAPSGFWAAYHLYLASKTIIADQKRAIGYTKDWAP
jgi:MFS family permease